MKQVFKRIKKFLKMARQFDGDILAVSHNGFMRRVADLLTNSYC